MEVLVLGGTGAMGIPLVQLLSQRGEKVSVTTRSQKQNWGNVSYICGNAKDPAFFEKLMTKNYDVIVDFMVYGTEELDRRLDNLLNHANQYIFFSSSRCYADSSVAIKENFPRFVFCKPFLHKIAKSFCRLLHLHFVGNCKTTAGSYSASHKPLQIIFSCYNTRYGNGSSEFSSSCACSLK